MQFIDDDWEMVIDNYFEGFNFCVSRFSPPQPPP
jgi:hypothetical protein